MRKAGAIMIGGIGGLLAAAAFTAWILIVVLKRLPQRGATWRFGLAESAPSRSPRACRSARWRSGFMALLLLTVVRGDLMQNWRASLPADAPNHFVLNVLPDQVDGVRAAMKAVDGLGHPALSDDSRTAGRGQRHSARHRAVLGDTRARRLAEREFNLSYASELPKTNRLVSGKWFDGGHRPGSGHLDGAGHRGVVAISSSATRSRATSRARR